MKKEEDITIHLTLRERIALHRGLAACLSGKNIDPEARGALSRLAGTVDPYPAMRQKMLADISNAGDTRVRMREEEAAAESAKRSRLLNVADPAPEVRIRDAGW